ncbi:hypothetical protein AB0B78_01165 [Streptomyces sp. NPDC040724]|uniref:hypothetical protein n=1 Tax=Streptomyces sp. NPDC040724 TaxID=3155612 RepID=UPI0033F43B8E
MGKIRDDFVAQVDQLKGHVSEKEYAEAIETLKRLGGDVGAFAALHAALIGVAGGATFGLAYVGAAMGPIAWGVTLVTAGSGIAFGYLFAAEKLNEWYEDLDSSNRAALAKVIAYGVTASRQLWRVWKWIAKSS